MRDVNNACWCKCDRFSGVAHHVIYLQTGVCSGGCSSQTFSDVVEVCDAWYKKWHAGLWVFAPKLFINARLPHEEGQSGDLGFSSVASPTWCQRNACTPRSFNPLKRLAHIVGSRVGTRVLHVSEATSIPAVDHMPISHLPNSCRDICFYTPLTACSDGRLPHNVCPLRLCLRTPVAWTLPSS